MLTLERKQFFATNGYLLLITATMKSTIGMIFMKHYLNSWICVLLLCCGTAWAEAPRIEDEFVGPFASWANLKRDYQAVGDGVADDSAALQKALNDLKVDGKPRVLYLPRGTYRITKGLQMISQIYFGVIGEDPANTIIKWDGAPGGTMLFCNGARYGRFGRLTWDGAGRAETAVDHKWDSQTPGANTHNEHADEVFKDVGFGIRAGKPHFMDAECAVLRCRFLRCSQAGVSIESFNALDWWIWHSYFEDCFVGVTNDPGAGHFHVYQSLFKNSTESDIKLSHCSYFSIRGNISIGSKAFYTGQWRDCAAQVTLQGNTIVDPTGPTPIQHGNNGGLLMVDNIIKSVKNKAKGEHIVHVSKATSLLAVGNTFTMADAIDIADKNSGAPVILNSKVVAPGSLKIALPMLPGTPPHLTRRVFEIASGADGAVIQKAIDDAAALKGERAVVHLPPGTYPIAKTLVVPANAGVQIVGDGFATRLQWQGDAQTPLLRLPGPSRAILRDLEIQAGAASAGIVVEKCDQSGARVFMEQGEVANAQIVGLLVDGLAHTDVSLHNFYHSGCKGVAVKVIGAGQNSNKNTARTVIFGGASSDNNLSYDVQNGGRLMAQDIWYEGAPPRFVHFTAASSGTFTLNGATTATGRPGPNMAAKNPNFAALEFEDFKGVAALLNVNIGTNLTLSGDGSQTRLLGMLHGSENAVVNRSRDAKVLLLGGSQTLPGGSASVIPNQGIAEPAFVLKMLEQLRTERPHPLATLPGGITDVRFYRVTVSGGQTSVHLTR